MMKITKLIEIIEKIAPPSLQEEWDNSGIQIMTDPERDVANVFVCLDITEMTLAEALEKKADFIITHHPLFFTGIKNISQKDPLGRHVLTLIKSGISVYSAHTSFDSVIGGNNDYIAKQFGVTDYMPIVPIGSEGHGMGRTAILKEAVSFAEFKKRAALIFGKYDAVRCIGDDDTSISKIGVCSGAGAEFIDRAAELGCHVYITGDLKYHEARHAQETGMCVIDGGHYGTEIEFTVNFSSKLSSLIKNDINIIKSEVDNNPFR